MYTKKESSLELVLEARFFEVQILQSQFPLFMNSCLSIDYTIVTLDTDATCLLHEQMSSDLFNPFERRQSMILEKLADIQELKGAYLSIFQLCKNLNFFCEKPSHIPLQQLASSTLSI